LVLLGAELALKSYQKQIEIEIFKDSYTKKENEYKCYISMALVLGAQVNLDHGQTDFFKNEDLEKKIRCNGIIKESWITNRACYS